MTGPSSSQDPTATTAGTAPAFDSALRGYDRGQVDGYVTAAAAEIARLRTELSESRRKQRLATDHAEATEHELRELRARPAAATPPAEEGFGFRAEKLLRLAEQEAAEVRGNASREASGIVEKARTEAEQHRHETEQGLIARASAMEQQAAKRTAELQDREQQIADQVAAAREQAEQAQTAAARAADRLRQESEAAAEQTRVRAEQLARRHREQAEQEVSRLTGLQNDVRAELRRLAEVLGSELNGSRHAAPAQRSASPDGDAPPAEAGSASRPATGGETVRSGAGNGRAAGDARGR